jgi:DNA-binding FadR family transcriptional regulator
MRLPLTESYLADSYLADSDEVHALIDRRVLLEIAVCHYAALSATDADLAAMRAAIERMSTAVDWAAYHAADEQFHLAVAAASALEFAQAPYASALTELYRYFLPYPIAYLHGVNDDHAALVEAISRRDPAAAAEIGRQHVSALHLSMFPSLASPD